MYIAWVSSYDDECVFCSILLYKVLAVLVVLINILITNKRHIYMDYTSNAHTGLVSVLCNKVAEYLYSVEELPVQSVLRFTRRRSISILNPDVSLVVLLNEDTLHDPKLVALALHLFL